MKIIGTTVVAGMLAVALAGCGQHEKPPVVAPAYSATPQMSPAPAMPPVSPPPADMTAPDAGTTAPLGAPSDADSGDSAGPMPHRSSAVAHVVRPASSHVSHIKGHTYVVKKGDTLGKIAKAHYGSASSSTIRKIVNANPSLKKNPNLIKIGQKLILP